MFPPGGYSNYGGPPFNPQNPGYGGPPQVPGEYGRPPMGFGYDQQYNTGPLGGPGGPNAGPYGGPGAYIGPEGVYRDPYPPNHPPQQNFPGQWNDPRFGPPGYPQGQQKPNEEEPDFKYFKSGEDWKERFHLEMGYRQSPIDIKLKEVTLNSYSDMKLHFTNKEVRLRTQYTPATFKIMPTSEPIAQITFTKDSRSQVYESNTLHFHAKSEHRLNEKHYDAEMHMVFKAVGPKSLHEEICVIGILFRINPIKSNEEQRNIIRKINPQREGENSINFHDLLTKILMFNPKFFHYSGSLTTPPCTETVNWFVYHQPIHVLYEDLQPFFSRWIDDFSFSNGKGNCRQCFHAKGRDVSIVNAHH